MKTINRNSLSPRSVYPLFDSVNFYFIHSMLMVHGSSKRPEINRLKWLNYFAWWINGTFLGNSAYNNEIVNIQTHHSSSKSFKTYGMILCKRLQCAPGQGKIKGYDSAFDANAWNSIIIETNKNYNRIETERNVNMFTSGWSIIDILAFTWVFVTAELIKRKLWMFFILFRFFYFFFFF